MKRLIRLLILCILCSNINLISQQNNTDSPTEPVKNHNFFVGVNLKIPYEETFYPIEKIWNGQAQIKVDGQVIGQKIDQIKQLRHERQTKISKYSAQINDLQCVPGYSIGSDPTVLAMSNQMAMASLADDSISKRDDALRRYSELSAFQEANAANQSTGPGAPPSATFDIESTLADIATQAEDFQMRTGYFTDQVEFYQDSNESGEPQWDVLNISFSIKSDYFFPRAHMAFIFQLKDEPEGEPTMSWFHFLSLENISPTEEFFDYQIRSYPSGKYIDSQDVFLFADGSEIATNHSQKHVKMTEEDARVYLNYQYLAQNEGKTRPPQRVWKYLSHEISDTDDSSLMEKDIILKIDKEGIVTDVIIDPKLRTVLTPHNINEISSQMYLPALVNGEPAAGELVLKMSDLTF